MAIHIFKAINPLDKMSILPLLIHAYSPPPPTICSPPYEGLLGYSNYLRFMYSCSDIKGRY